MEVDGDGADEAGGDKRGVGLEIVPGREGGAVRGGARGEAFCEPFGIGEHHIAAVGGGREFDVGWELFVADEAVGPGVGEVDFEDVRALLEGGFWNREGPGFAPDCAAGLTVDAEGRGGAVDFAEGEGGEVEEGCCGGERDGIAIGGCAREVFEGGVAREGPVGEGDGFEGEVGAVEGKLPAAVD